MKEEIKDLEVVIQALINKVNSLNNAIESMVSKEFKQELFKIQDKNNQDMLYYLNESLKINNSALANTLKQIQKELNDVLLNAELSFRNREEISTKQFFNNHKKKLLRTNLVSWFSIFILMLFGVITLLNYYRTEKSISQKSIEIKYRLLKQNKNQTIQKSILRLDSIEKMEGIEYLEKNLNK